MDWGDYTRPYNRKLRTKLVVLDRVVAAPNVRQLAIPRLTPNPKTQPLQGSFSQPQSATY